MIIKFTDNLLNEIKELNYTHQAHIQKHIYVNHNSEQPQLYNYLPEIIMYRQQNQKHRQQNYQNNNYSRQQNNEHPYHLKGSNHYFQPSNYSSHKNRYQTHQNSNNRSPIYQYNYPAQTYQNSFQQQNLFFQSPSHYVPQINNKQIMQTILNTTSMIQKTKKYVENIPIKSQFYSQTFQSQSKQKLLNDSRFYKKVPFEYTFLKENEQKSVPQKQNRVQITIQRRYQNKAQQHNKQQQIYHTSQKMHQHTPQVHEEKKQVKSNLNDIQNVSHNIAPDNKQKKILIQDDNNINQKQSDLKQFEQIQKDQQRKQLLVQTFRPIISKHKIKQQEQIKRSTKNIGSYLNTQYKTPKSRQKPVNTQQKLSTDAKSQQQKNIQKLLKSPLSKTFEAYSNFSYSSSNNSSARSGNSVNKTPKNEKQIKLTPTNSKQKAQQMRGNIKSNEVIRYFKKKDQSIHGHISSFSPRYNQNKLKAQVKQRSKSKFPQNKIFTHDQVKQSQFTLQNLQKVKSKFVSPLQRSPRTVQTNIKGYLPQNQADFTRQCCTPFSRNNINTRQIQLNINKKQSPKSKIQPKKLFSSNDAIYPFDNLQKQNQKTKQQAPTQQVSAYKSISPLTPSNKRSKQKEQQNANQFLKVNQSEQTRDRIRKTSSKYFQKPAMRQKSPEIQHYQSAVYNGTGESFYSPVNKNLNLNQQQNEVTLTTKLTSPTNRKKQGIKVLLSSPKNIQIDKISCQIPLQVENAYSNKSKKYSSNKKRYLQISIEQNSSQSQQQQIIQQLALKQQQKDNQILKTYEKAQQKHQLSKMQQKQKSSKKTIAQKINEQLNKLQILNKVDNQLMIKQHAQSKQKLQRNYNQKQQPSLKSSKKFQRTNSNSKKSIILNRLDESFEMEKKQQHVMQKQMKNKGQQPQIKTSSNNIASQPHPRANRLSINAINQLIIKPSSLQKYQSHQQLAKESALNNTISYTTPQKQQKIKFQQALPKTHIIRLQKSMQKLQQQFLEKNKNRRKIFNDLIRSEKINKNKKSIIFENPLAQGPQQNQQQYQTKRIQRLYKRDVKNHNKTMQAKLYHLLVQEDTISKRSSQKKNKFSPIKNRNTPKNISSNLKSKRVTPKIFEVQPSKHYTTPSRKASPREPQSTKFRYRPINQHQRNYLCRSVQNFQQSMRSDSLDRNSVQRILDDELNTDRKSIQRMQRYTKLNEDEIRRQIKKIKQYDFIQRYMTNYELQQVMRDYIHRSISPRKWSLMIIDEVYKRIRAKQQAR